MLNPTLLAAPQPHRHPGQCHQAGSHPPSPGHHPCCLFTVLAQLSSCEEPEDDRSPCGSLQKTLPPLLWVVERGTGLQSVCEDPCLSSATFWVSWKSQLGGCRAQNEMSPKMSLLFPQETLCTHGQWTRVKTCHMAEDHGRSQGPKIGQPPLGSTGGNPEDGVLRVNAISAILKGLLALEHSIHLNSTLVPTPGPSCNL
jgi:hypothetical protein